jgi:hypothetical protein
MTALIDSSLRFYNDGPSFATTPALMAAEKAYRQAYHDGAQEAATWYEPNEKRIEQAWEARRTARRRAKVENYPLCTYVAFHDIDAAASRGMCQAMENAARIWRDMRKLGMSPRDIRSEILIPWAEAVARWMAKPIDPSVIHPPPGPEEFLTPENRRVVDLLPYTKATAAIPSTSKVVAPAGPAAITRRLNDVTREVLEWLWPGRVPLGKLTLLAGDPGLGKSFVTLDMAARVSRGEPWPDTPLLRQTPGGVILLNCEDDIGDTIAPRLDKAGADDTRIVLIEGVSMLGQRRQFSLEADLPRLEEVLGANPGTRLVVIDPIAAYCGNVDSHKNSDVRGMLAPLAELAGRHRVAVLTVTHLSKSGGSKAVYRAMGSLAFAAAARAVWAIIKDKDQAERRLFLPAKLNLARNPDGLAYRIEQGRVEWEYEPVQMHADDAFAAEMESSNAHGHRGADRQEAAHWLSAQLLGGPLATTQVMADAKEHGFSERTLRRAFKELGGRSKRGRDGQWHWSLANQDGQLLGQQDGHEPRDG